MIRELAPKAFVGDGLAIEMPDVERIAEKAVAQWLDSLYQDKRLEQTISKSA